MENALQRPLHLFVCMIQSNKPSLRHFLTKINGNTVGPPGLSGPTGKLLAPSENLPIVKFEPGGDFNWDSESSDPSTDQVYI